MTETTLAGFPVFFKGETVINNLARFTKRHEPVSYVDWLQDLFGKPYQYAIVDLPTNLDRLTKRIAGIYHYDTEYLVNHHTAAPYYRLGRSESQNRQLSTAMKEQNAANIHIYAGLSNADVLRPHFLRGCIKCVETDRTEYGEAFLHRDHHLAGIETCSEHGIWLSDTGCPISKLTTFVTLEDVIHKYGIATPKQNVPDTRLVTLARDAKYLLDHPTIQIDLSKIHQLYRVACTERGFVGKAGKLHVREVAESVRDYYPAELLMQLNLPLNPNINKSWVYELFAAPHVSRPAIKHLLAIQGLGYSFEELLNLKLAENSQPNPFGEAPWICLNKTAAHYMQPVIHECRLTIIDQRIRGEFSCECGYCYSLTELQGKQPHDRNNRIYGNYTIRVLKYGDQWDSALRRMWNTDNYKLKDMAHALGISGDTVKAQAPRLGLPFPPPGSPNLKPPPLEKQRVQRDIRTEYQAKWLKGRNEHSDASITELRNLLPDEAAWLHLYDRKWFNSNKPEPLTPSKPHKDWNAYDQVLASEVDKVGLKRSSDLTGPRITAPVISQDLGFSSSYLRSQLSKLPQTKQVLDKYLESHEQYALRRLESVRSQAINKEMPLTVYQIRKKAGISELLAGREVIKLRIYEIAGELKT